MKVNHGLTSSVTHSSPYDYDSGKSHWRQAAFLLDTPLSVTAGQQVSVTLQLDLSLGLWCTVLRWIFIMMLYWCWWCCWWHVKPPVSLSIWFTFYLAFAAYLCSLGMMRCFFVCVKCYHQQFYYFILVYWHMIVDYFLAPTTNNYGYSSYITTIFHNYCYYYYA